MVLVWIAFAFIQLNPEPVPFASFEGCAATYTEFFSNGGHEREREPISIPLSAFMKMGKLRALLAGVEDDVEVFFSQDEELNAIYPLAMLTDLDDGRVMLLPFGTPEEPEFTS